MAALLRSRQFTVRLAFAPAHPATMYFPVKHRGLFITFEGMDGSGKTTQMHRLAERLRGMGRTVLETVEPGGPPIAQKIRRILLDSANQELSPTAELLLYFASRAQNVDQWILPALERGEVVLSDRFTDSSLVYQGCGRGLGSGAVMDLDRIACRGLKPDLTILVDVDAESSLSRARARNAAEPHCETRMDDQSLEFHTAVWQAYHRLAEAEPGRVKLVNGRADIDTIEREVWSIVSAYV
jgi:dTMP kinase